MNTTPTLRQLRTNRGLNWIAERLTTTDAGEPMNISTVRSLARWYSVDNHSDDRTANAVLNDILHALPTIRRNETRTQHADRIRLLTQEVTP